MGSVNERAARYAKYEGALLDTLRLIGEQREDETGVEWTVRGILAVADAERVELVAENRRLKQGGAELGKIVQRHCEMVLDATGLHDWIDEDGDGDWGAVWENLAELRPRAEAAEAKVAQVEALFSGGPDTSCATTWRSGPVPECSAASVECVEVPLAELRAALATEPTP